MMRGALLVLGVLLIGTGRSTSVPVRIGLFTLFHPRELVVRSPDARGISLRFDHHTCVLRGHEQARLRATSGSIEVVCADQTIATGVVHISGADVGVADIELTVPQKITRTFRGLLEVSSSGEALVPIVSMDLETAVASVVSAEQSASTPIDALEAQAVAVRSYLVAGHGRHGRHGAFDFCDTTHCQFLKSPPAAGEAAARAAADTAGLVLAFRGVPIAALYSASCGGRTRSLADAGLPSGGGYPYFSVECSYCVRHAPQWESRLDADEETSRLIEERSERARLAVGRRHGWSIVPGNNFDAVAPDTIRGRGAGHGIGLCQAGAAALANDGASFRDILAHYYPGTALTSVD
jgi:stage II sporulation protein D